VSQRARLRFAGRGSADRREAWRIDYNTVRPHGRLGRLPPAVFGATRRPEEQRGGTLRSIGGFAPRPFAPPSERAKEEQTQSADV
jgi:putative transposase